MMDFANGMMAGWTIMLSVALMQIVFFMCVRLTQLFTEVFDAYRGRYSVPHEDVLLPWREELSLAILTATFIMTAPIWAFMYSQYGDAAAGAFLGVYIGLATLNWPLHRGMRDYLIAPMLDPEKQRALADRIKAKRQSA